MSKVRLVPTDQNTSNEQRQNDLCQIPYDISVTVDGEAVPARSGETILSLLFAMGRKDISMNDKDVVSGAYCGMGVCFCCIVEVNEVPKVRACKARLSDGMAIRTKVNLKTNLEEVRKA